ncbi:MAG: gamma-glutamylcyclotransferase family protein [Alphaproteobacteria bacterium]
MANSKKSADTRLATYGTLAPGQANNDQLADLKGNWRQGTVRGRLVEAGWGAELGYPGLILDPAGQVIEVYIFESSELPNHWLRLDEFEGAGYRRVVTQVSTVDGDLDASIYVIDT